MFSNLELNIYFLKSIILNLYTYICFKKISNTKHVKTIKTILIVIINLLFSMACAYIEFYVNSFLPAILECFLYGVIMGILTRNKIGYSIIITMISYSICILFYVISVIVEFIIYKLGKFENYYIDFVIIVVIQTLLLYNFLKIKKFKNGFDFLYNRLNNDFTDIIMINLSTIVIIIYCLIGTIYDEITSNLLISFIILGIMMLLIIQRMFITYNKQKIFENTLKQYEIELNENKIQIQNLETEKYNISKITHEFYNRQKALEMFVKENMKTESSEELSLLNKIQELTNEYSQRIKDIKTLPELEFTGIQEIDNMFKYMQKECYDNNIEFNLKISGNIYHLVNNIIPKNKLETMIGDHIRDAIIAVNSSKSNNREIFVILGIRDKKYELCIYDTGIEFEIETLLKLGTKPITTHKDTGGSGMGFMTTFETINQTKASLIIKENPPIEEKHYTKAVIIRFDNLNQYKICSYRADEIEKNKKERNIIIEKI